MTKLYRNDDGTLPAYAWPGGYPIIYILADGEILCPACANDANGWRIMGADIHYEGPPELCCHCNAEIESAYGEPGETE